MVVVLEEEVLVARAGCGTYNSQKFRNKKYYLIATVCDIVIHVVMRDSIVPIAHLAFRNPLLPLQGPTLSDTAKPKCNMQQARHRSASASLRAPMTGMEAGYSHATAQRSRPWI